LEPLAQTLLLLGGLFSLGVVTDVLGRRTPLPRVTLLLVFGVLIGPSGLDLLPDLHERWFASVAHLALVMVGFLLGGRLTGEALRERGGRILTVSITCVLVTASVVFGGLLLIGVPVLPALLLAGISTSTAPAATQDVAHEVRADGSFTRTLLGIVALDDAWGLVLFSLVLAAAQLVDGQPGAWDVLGHGAWEVGGAALVGIAVGLPMAFLTGRIEPGEPTQAEALAGVLLCGGIALWLDVSYLLASMVLGAVVANLARHHSRPFHEIEGIEWPFMILFFGLAGASLRIESLGEVGWLGLAYVAFRVAGRILGGFVGTVREPPGALIRRWLGLSLLPQAGVAIGMALVATQRFPGLAETILPLVIGSTVLFELVGPVLTRAALVRSGEACLDRAHRP
jgi:Kef-type K+ transport system membrane component KefB